MPKIGKHRVIIKGNFVELTIMYNRKNNFHFSESLPEIEAVTNWRNVGYNTERDLLSSLFDALNKYHDIISKTRKVICITYQVGINTAMNKTGDGSWTGKTGKWRKVEHFGLEYGIGFTYEIIMEKSGKNVKYFRLTDGGSLGYEIHLSKSNIIVKHSDKKEAFLLELSMAADSMANKFVDFFLRKDLDKLLELGTTKLLTQ